MANPVNVGSTPDAPSSAPKTTTRKTLWGLCVVLLIATTVVFGTSLWVFQKVHRTVETVRSHTAPSILEVLATREALVKADRAAIDSFRSGQVKLSGPGLQHQNQLTLASQSLTKVAEHNAAAGNVGSQRIQLLEGLLESYSGLVGQAHAHFGTAVGTADLWSASHLLHAGDSPILPELDELLNDQTRALSDQVAVSSMTAVTLLTWVVAVPIVVLFVLLVVTQAFLKRRFRRATNPFLLIATVVLIGLSIVIYITFVSQHPLKNTQDTLGRVAREWKADTSAADAKGQHELGLLVMLECRQEKGGCGPTVNQLDTNRDATDSTADKNHDERVAKWARDVDEQTGTAAQHSSLWLLSPLATALIAVLIPFGLVPRIEEYRYRPR
jgi:hypothetical protein